MPRLFALRHAVNFERVALIKVRLQHAGGFGRGTFNNCQIAFLGLVPMRLQDGLRGLSFRENHQSGRLAVQPMDDPDSLGSLSLTASQVVRQERMSRLLPLRVARHAQQIFGFLDYDQGRVLKQNLHSRWQVALGASVALVANRNQIARQLRMVESSERLPIDLNHSVLEPALDLGPRHLRMSGEQKGQQFRRLFDNV